jgi:hypothetical protein
MSILKMKYSRGTIALKPVLFAGWEKHFAFMIYHQEACLFPSLSIEVSRTRVIYVYCRNYNETEVFSQPLLINLKFHSNSVLNYTVLNNISSVSGLLQKVTT